MVQQYGLIFLLGFVFVFSSVAAAAENPGAELKVYNEALHDIDLRLFGQFLERASFGEPGPEAFTDPQTGKLPDKIVKMLKAMQISVIRFPGGTDIDYIDWRDMIDNVPGRSGSRPVTSSYRPDREKPTTITNNFGYDEYFELRDELGCQTILVVNLLDGLAKRMPLEKAAVRAAGLIAYANAKVGAKLPDTMPDWPAIRKLNGYTKTFNAEYVQIGNEMFLQNAKKQVREALGTDEPAKLAKWYVEVLTAYIKAIRAVDSDIEIIIDAWMGKGVSEVIQTDPYIKANVAMLARHQYAPGGCDKIKMGQEDIAASTLTDQQLWWAWTSMPGAVDESGQNQSYWKTLDETFDRGYKVASTEWNWNGWSWQGLTEYFEAPAAAGIGAAAFIQGMMRNGDKIVLANQSMLLGSSWGIAAIFGDPAGKHEPYYNTQGSSTTFYRKHHGSKFFKSNLTGVKTHTQPYSFGWGGGVTNEVAELDVMVSGDDSRIFVHAINRTFDSDLELKIDLSDFGKIAAIAKHHTLTFKLFGKPGHGYGRDMATQDVKDISAAKNMTITLPARTISILEFLRAK